MLVKLLGLMKANLLVASYWGRVCWQLIFSDHWAVFLGKTLLATVYLSV